jgi:tRNA A-37 threonylcarbamoyl transferase component Bud32
MTWSEAELHALAEAHWRGQNPRCPICKAPVDVHEMRTLGSKSTPLMMHCRRCGVDGQFREDHLDAMNLEWSLSERKSIVESYWENGYADCPVDGAGLNVQELRTLGAAEPTLFIICRRCGRNCDDSTSEEAQAMSPFEEKYETLRVLNQGGMGRVLQVRDRKSGRELAAKTVLPEFFRDPEMIRRFEREKGLLLRINHPNVLGLLDSFVDERGGVFVMELMRGGTLAQKINDSTTSAVDLANMFDDVVAGIEAVHAMGIAHRDLKPANVLIDSDGRAKVSDFGLAVLKTRETTKLTATGAFLGTEQYAAPEQFSDSSRVNTQADIFSLGLIAYEIAIRQSPYQPPIVAVNDSQFDTVLSKALQRNPASRTVTARDIASALRGVVTARNR